MPAAAPSTHPAASAAPQHPPPAMTDLPHEELLTGYLDGELSAEESELVEQMLRTSAEAQQLLEELRALRDSIRALPRYALGAGPPSDTFAQRVLQRAERAMLLPEDAAASAAEEDPLVDEGTQESAQAAPPASEPAAEPAGPHEPNQAPGVSTFNGGAGWKRLLAAAAVLAAAITLMVIGPAQRGPVGDTVALQSDRARKADAPAKSEFANTGMVESAPRETDGAGIEAFNPFIAPPEGADSAAGVSAPGVPAPTALPPRPGGFEVEGAVRPESAAARSRYFAEPQPAAAPMTQMSAPSQDISSFKAGSERLPPTNGARPAADSYAITAGSGETPRSRIAGPSLVVHVQLTEDAWQAGRFAQLLSRRQIAWQHSASPADDVRTRAESTAGDRLRNTATNLHLMQASASVESMQALLGDLETAAAQDSGVVALAVATPDAASHREGGSLAMGGIDTDANDSFGRLQTGPSTAEPARRMAAATRGGRSARSDLNESDEVAPSFSPLDPKPQSATPVEPERGLLPKHQATAGAQAPAAPVERQLGRAIRLETTSPEALARDRKAAPAHGPVFENYRGEAAPAQSAQILNRGADDAAIASAMPKLAEPVTASKQGSAQAKQDSLQVDAAQEKRPAAPTTDALFIIQIVPSPGR